MRREHFRGVIWPRDPMDGKHRYVIVGMLVTDEPLDTIDGVQPNGISELFVDGNCSGVSYVLEVMKKYKSRRPLGDAVNVLLSLEDLPQELIPLENDEAEE